MTHDPRIVAYTRSRAFAERLPSASADTRVVRMEILGGAPVGIEGERVAQFVRQLADERSGPIADYIGTAIGPAAGTKYESLERYRVADQLVTLAGYPRA